MGALCSADTTLFFIEEMGMATAIGHCRVVFPLLQAVMGRNRGGARIEEETIAPDGPDFYFFAEHCWP